MIGVKLPPNLNEPIDLSDYVPRKDRKDLSQNKVDDKYKTVFSNTSWDNAILDKCLKELREINDQIMKERELMYSFDYNQSPDQLSDPWHDDLLYSNQISVGLSRERLGMSVLAGEIFDLHKPWWKFW